SPFFTLHLLDLPDLENDGKGEYEENGIGQVHTQYDIGLSPRLSYRFIMLSSSSVLTFIFTGGATDTCSYRTCALLSTSNCWLKCINSALAVMYSQRISFSSAAPL